MYIQTYVFKTNQKHVASSRKNPSICVNKQTTTVASYASFFCRFLVFPFMYIYTYMLMCIYVYSIQTFQNKQKWCLLLD